VALGALAVGAASVPYSGILFFLANCGWVARYREKTIRSCVRRVGTCFLTFFALMGERGHPLGAGFSGVVDDRPLISTRNKP
jgi:hypothetical protein